MDDYGLETVQEYMYHIRSNAENCVRNLLRDVAKRAGSSVLSAVDYLDDGSPVGTAISSICAFHFMLSFGSHRYRFEWKSMKKKVQLFWTLEAQAAKSEEILTHLSQLYIQL